MALFKLLFAFIWVIPAIIQYRLTKGEKKHLVFLNTISKRSGNNCYNCNTILDRKYLHSEENLKLCKGCNRDLSIQLLESNRFFSRFNCILFKKWLISKESDKIIWILPISLIFLISGLFVDNTFYKNFSSITNSSIIGSYWILQAFKTYINKKPPKEGV